VLLDDPTPTDHVIEQARHRAEVTRDHVESALDLVEQEGGPFDFLSIAIAAHCSVAYLRQHREFATRIRALQATVPPEPRDARDEQGAALRRRLAQADHRVAALRARVERLEAENARLRDRLASLRSAPAVRLRAGIHRPGGARPVG
jgi:cell division protein FtsB